MKMNAKHKTQRHSPSPTTSLSSRASSIASLSDRSATQKRPVSSKATKKSQSSNIPKTTNRNPSESSSGKVNKIPIASRPNKIQLSKMTDLKTPCSSKSCTPSPTLWELEGIKRRISLYNKIYKDNVENKTNVQPAEDLLKQSDKKSHEEEHPICNNTSDINAETSKTVCLSDKTDHVPTADQIKEEPFDFCEAQNTNIITNQQLQKQVQDPLMEIRSISNSKTINPMDIQQKPEVHSSIESVCSEQYWSASEGENEHDNVQLDDRVVPMNRTNETMDSTKTKRFYAANTMMQRTVMQTISARNLTCS
ncbi:Hypothetical predicted protein [Mytilus galloprovincialis]|uniref:Uncharacterized protein n=1 Tax=Mytilus galloprovincialis TaxID=29158 RepID=A0A8B6F5X1_MYTGA|nr:Hypothetical predicted protein [Mytilus galloprovincialis]